jgi:hypothetical protein
MADMKTREEMLRQAQLRSQYNKSVKSSKQSCRSGKSAKSLSIALGQEKKKRKKLEGEVKDIKNQLTNLYETLSKS